MRPAVKILLACLLAAALAGCSASPSHTVAPTSSATASAAASDSESMRRVSVEDARGLIRAYLQKHVPDFNIATLKDLAETDFGKDDLFEQTGTQFFLLNGWLYALRGSSVTRSYMLALS